MKLAVADAPLGDVATIVGECPLGVTLTATVMPAGKLAPNVVVKSTALPSVTTGVPLAVETTLGNAYTSLDATTLETLCPRARNSNVRLAIDPAVYGTLSVLPLTVAPLKLANTPSTYIANSESADELRSPLLANENVSRAAEPTTSLCGSGTSELTLSIEVGSQSGAISALGTARVISALSVPSGPRSFTRRARSLVACGTSVTPTVSSGSEHETTLA